MSLDVAIETKIISRAAELCPELIVFCRERAGRHLHQPRFSPDEAAIEVGVKVFSRLCTARADRGVA